MSLSNEEDKVIVFEKGGLVFVFNFHSNNSYSDYDVGTFSRSNHFLIFDGDEERYDGHKRLDDAHCKWFKPEKKETNKRPFTLKLYLPSRTCFIVCPYEVAKDKTFAIPEMPKVEIGENLMNDDYESQQPVRQTPVTQLQPPTQLTSQAPVRSSLAPPKRSENEKNRDEVDKKFNDLMAGLGDNK